MKHLKLFEAFGIDLDIEDQVDKYFDEIQKNPQISDFNFSFQNEKDSTFFKLRIDPSINSSGEFIEGDGYFEVVIKNRHDVETLLHEVKHLDFRIKNKKLHQSVYYKANEILKNFTDTPKVLAEIFYLYDENEFQSKYHSYYKGFKLYCKDKLTSNSNFDKVKYLWMKYLLSCNDKSWVYYLIDKEFKLSNYISNKKLDACIYQMIQAGITEKPDLFKWSKNWIINNIKLLWNQFRKKLGYYTKEERSEIDKIKKYFETIFQQRHTKYKKKFSRMILLVADQYQIKY
jgi:hypothetical protein